MALIIRMRQQGANSRQHFRIVVADVRAPRDGKYVEKLGWYNPFAPKEKSHFLDIEKFQYWVNHGVQVSDRVRALVRGMAPDLIKQMIAKKVAQRDKARRKRRQKKG